MHACYSLIVNTIHMHAKSKIYTNFIYSLYTYMQYKFVLRFRQYMQLQILVNAKCFHLYKIYNKFILYSKIDNYDKNHIYKAMHAKRG